MSAPLWAAVLLLCSPQVLAEGAHHVPSGKVAMIDGKISSGEWDDAAAIDVDGFVRLYAKQSSGYVWLAVDLLNGESAVVDLYISPANGSIHDLHASAKLGERSLTHGTWPDWVWWNNRDWVANVSCFESFEERRFLPEKVREFQIARTKFPGSQWKVMLEVMTPASPEWKLTRCPRDTRNDSNKGWINLQLQ